MSQWPTSGLGGRDCWKSHCWLGSVSWKIACVNTNNIMTELSLALALRILSGTFSTKLVMHKRYNATTNTSFHKMTSSIHWIENVLMLLRSKTVAPSFAVCQSDALSRHFEVDHCCHWTWTQSQSTLGCLGNRLGPRQRLGFHRVQVEHVAGLFMREMRKYRLT